MKTSKLLNMETQNYYLREIEDSDIHHIHKGLSNRAVTKYYDVHYDTLEETKEQMNWFAKLKKNGTGLWWGIYDKKADEFCGAGGYNDLDKEARRAEIGIWLLKEYWGRGIMKEIAPKLCELGFINLNLNRIEGYVVSGNVKCKAAIKKINFTYEGTMREFEIKDGEKISLDVYSLLKSEWEGEHDQKY